MNESNVEGAFDKAKGKVKEAVGNTFNDQSLANSGAADQVKGSAKETWGNVKDTAHDATHDSSVRQDAHEVKHGAENVGEKVRDAVTSAATSVKNAFSRGAEDVKEGEHHVASDIHRNT